MKNVPTVLLKRLFVQWSTIGNYRINQRVRRWPLSLEKTHVRDRTRRKQRVKKNNENTLLLFFKKDSYSLRLQNDITAGAWARLWVGHTHRPVHRDAAAGTAAGAGHGPMQEVICSQWWLLWGWMLSSNKLLWTSLKAGEKQIVKECSVRTNRSCTA